MSSPEVPEKQESPSRHPTYILLAAVSIISLVADLLSKDWAKKRLENPEPPLTRRVEVLGDRISFIFARNRGGAFGLLQDESEAIRKPFFFVVSLCAIVFIVYLYRSLQPNQRALKWGLPLVLGGAIGNLVDRIRYGFVVDFIDVRLTQTYHWPTFNVADIAICVGVGLMAIDMFSSRPKPVVASSVADAEDASNTVASDSAPKDDSKPTSTEEVTTEETRSVL